MRCFNSPSSNRRRRIRSLRSRGLGPWLRCGCKLHRTYRTCDAIPAYADHAPEVQNRPLIISNWATEVRNRPVPASPWGERRRATGVVGRGRRMCPLQSDLSTDRQSGPLHCRAEQACFYTAMDLLTAELKSNTKQAGISAASTTKIIPLWIKRRFSGMSKNYRDSETSKTRLAVHERTRVGKRDQVAAGGLPWNGMLHFFAIEACSTATIWPFICASSAAVCLSPPTKKAAGQKMTIAAAVATPSFVR